jgi:hypothetical protein
MNTAQIFEIQPFRYEIEGESRFGRGAGRMPQGRSAASRPWPSFRKRRTLRTPSIYGGWGAYPPPADPASQPEPASPSAAAPEHVRWLQSTLNRAMGSALPIDGIMSPALRGTIRDFQQKAGLPASGYVGPDTEAALRRVGAGPEGGELEFETESELQDPAASRVDTLLWGRQSMPPMPFSTRFLHPSKPSPGLPKWSPKNPKGIPETAGWYRIFTPPVTDLFPVGGFYTGKDVSSLHRRLTEHFAQLRHLGVDYRPYRFTFVAQNDPALTSFGPLNIRRIEEAINRHYRGPLGSGRQDPPPPPLPHTHRQVLNLVDELEFPKMETTLERDQYRYEPNRTKEAIMHPIGCTCPRCLSGGTGEFEFEYESFESGEVSEQEELELAMELLSVQNEYEMEQFLGKLVGSIGSGLKSIGKVALPALKSLAKVALPIAGTALGSFIPIPGVGSMIGGALGRAAANALEMEYAGMDRAEADLEKARRMVGVLRSAVQDLSLSQRSGSPESVARSVLTSALQSNIPGTRLPMPGVAAPAGFTATPSTAATLQTGRWWRRGNTILVDGA